MPVHSATTAPTRLSVTPVRSAGGEVRQRGRHAHPPEDVPAARAHRAHQQQQLRVGGAQPLRAVTAMGKKAISAQIDHLGRRAVADPQHEQRRQGDHRDGLRRDDERREQPRRGGASAVAAAAKRERERRSEQQAGGGLGERDQRVAGEEAAARPPARRAPPTAAGRRRAPRASTRTTSSTPSVSATTAASRATRGAAAARAAPAGCARGARRAASPRAAGSPSPLLASRRLPVSKTTKPGPTLRRARASRVRGHSRRRRRLVHHARTRRSHTLEAGLLAPGSSSGRAFPPASWQWLLAAFVPGHSGGSAPVLHRLPSGGPRGHLQAPRMLDHGHGGAVKPRDDQADARLAGPGRGRPAILPP